MSFFNRPYNDDDLLGFSQNNRQDLDYDTSKNKYKVLKVISLICFILICVSKFLFIFAIPLGLFGIISAFLYTILAKRICWSGFLNVIAIAISLFMIQAMLSYHISSYPQEIINDPEVSFEISDVQYKDNVIANTVMKIRDRYLNEIEAQISQLQGNWILTDGQNETNIVKCTFNKDNSFNCSKYGDEEKTYVKGTYKIKSLKIEGNDWNPIALSDFDWNYLIETTINDCSVNGVIQEKPLLERYNIEIFSNNGVYESEGFFTNSNNKYSYSGKRYK